MTKVIMRCLKLLKLGTENERGEEGLFLVQFLRLRWPNTFEIAVAFQFTCLGADEGVKRFFRFVDDHVKIGHRVDCVLPGSLKRLLKDSQY